MPLKRLNKIPVFTGKEIESRNSVTAPRFYQPRITIRSDPVQDCTRRKKVTVRQMKQALTSIPGLEELVSLK